MTDLRRELTIATRAAESAGELILSYYSETIPTREKSAGDPVTEADLKANACIRTILGEAFPGDGWLSEETADSPERLSRRRVWIVDPLDGTREFIGGVPEYCVSISLVEDGRPVLGVAFNPARREMFAGAADAGVTCNDRPVRVSAVTDLRAARVLASRSEEARGEWDAYKSLVQVEPTGSVAYKLALVAAGRADATFTLTPKNEWDICAGVALIHEAGGRVTDSRGRELRFNQPQTRLPGLIASNGKLHGAIERMIGLPGRGDFAV